MRVMRQPRAHACVPETRGMEDGRIRNRLASQARKGRPDGVERRRSAAARRGTRSERVLRAPDEGDVRVSQLRADGAAPEGQAGPAPVLTLVAPAAAR